MELKQRAPLRPVRMGDLSAVMEQRANGERIIRPTRPLGSYPKSLTEHLNRHAKAIPDRTFLADRGPDGEWRPVSYAQALDRAWSVASFLIGHGASTERPLAILSGNSVAHGTMALGAMLGGVAYAPVSPPYSLVSKDFGKLRHVFGLLTPGVVFVEDTGPFEAALRAVMVEGMALIARDNSAGLPGCVLLDEVLATPVSAAAQAAEAALGPDTIAKFLFTSGSTGMPKAVINTQRMLTANQAMIGEALAFLNDEPPVLVDWLPWNHTAGGNHNFGLALTHGGTLYIDNGSPTPAGIARTVRNLSDVSPTVYFNVPKGYEMLSEHLATNAPLRKSFFARVKLLQYAGAGLPQHVWDALEDLAALETGERVTIITGYGSTETAPFASTTTWPVGRPGEIGLPAPGVTFKLVPAAEKFELRISGDGITPGYWRQPEMTANSFDDEGFYRIGDALKLVDDADISKGLLFDGRVSEDFKLSTGTWVNFAAVRAAIIRGFAPYVRDAVLAGLDRSYIAALLIPDMDAMRKLAPDLAAKGEAALANDPIIMTMISERLAAMAAASTGSSTFVARAALIDGPLSIDAGEITDKGSTNQRAVLQARSELVAALYTDPPPAHVAVATPPVRS